MKTFKQYLEEANNDYKVGDTIKFNPGVVAAYNNVADFGGLDWGKVTATGETYTVKLDNGNEIKVKSADAYAYGNADGDPNP